MATVEEPQVHVVAPPRVVIHDVSWQEYELFLKAMGNRYVYLTYDRGELEIMSPLRNHERGVEALAVMIPLLLRAARVGYTRGGMQTCKHPDLVRGFEPDRCWWIGHYPEIMSCGDDIDMTRDPPPDLTLEIDATSSSVNRMAIFASFGVPEVWRYQHGILQAHVLLPKQTYEARDNSPIFPWLALADLIPFIELFGTINGLIFEDQFAAWAVAQYQAYQSAGNS